MLSVTVARWLCAVCNVVHCVCLKWVHKKCTGTCGSLYKARGLFVCCSCVNHRVVHRVFVFQISVLLLTLFASHLPNCKLFISLFHISLDHFLTGVVWSAFWGGANCWNWRVWCRFWSLLQHECPQRSLSTLPLSTSFCRGWGKTYSVNGEVSWCFFDFMKL